MAAPHELRENLAHPDRAASSRARLKRDAGEAEAGHNHLIEHALRTGTAPIA